MKKSNLFLFTILLVSEIAKGQFIPTKQWDFRYGGDYSEIMTSFQQTTDGGYILGGWSTSLISGDKTQANWGFNSVDYWVIKIDANGSKQWDARFGGTSSDDLVVVRQTTDGGYILGGNSFSPMSGDKTQSSWGGSDYWVVKITSNGMKQWDARFGGSEGEELHALKQTADGGYILGGTSISPISGDKTQANWGVNDYWIVKIDANGTKQWDKRYGGTESEFLYALEQTTEGGYILGGYSNSEISGDKTQGNQGGGASDYWIVKIDANGSKQWDARFGGNAGDELISLKQSTDGGYILGGVSYSGIGGDKSQSLQGGYDYWVVKTDGTGIKQWDARFGGSGYDYLGSLQQTNDGGYIFGGYTDSGLSGDKTQPSQGFKDYWIVKTASNGTKQWDVRYGGIRDDVFAGLEQTSDGGFLFGGYSSSEISGDKTQPVYGGYMLADFWIVKTTTGCAAEAVYADNDGDGFGNINDTTTSIGCVIPAGYVINSADCNDNLITYADNDGDGYGAGLPVACGIANHTDCNDANTSIHPGVADVCNNIDDNCNGITDENSFAASITPTGSVAICDGASVTFTANGGTGITYQWMKGTKNISGATSQTYVAKKAATYSVKESNSYGCSSTSSATTLTVNPLPDAIITYTTLDLCGLSSVLLKANSGTGLTYQWKKGSSNIGGATNKNYSATSTGTYKVVVTNNNGCSKTSPPAQVVKSCKETHLADDQNDHLKVYPNPTDGEFTVELQTNTEETSEAIIQVINVMGQKLLEERMALTGNVLPKDIYLKAPPGIYFVKVIANGHPFMQQLIINH